MKDRAHVDLAIGLLAGLRGLCILLAEKRILGGRRAVLFFFA
jgi:hypothetical protein